MYVEDLLVIDRSLQASRLSPDGWVAHPKISPHVQTPELVR